VFIVLGLLALLLGLAVAAPRVVRFLTRPVPGAEEPGEAPKPVAESGEEGGAEAQRRIDVKLFFQSPGARGLVIEDRPVKYSEDLAQQLRFVVEALVEGSKTGMTPTMPPETKVLDIFVNEQGTAYVDLSGDIATRHTGGSDAELATVYSVVNSLTSNFPAVKRVQILLDDRPAATLAGHVSLTRPLYPDMTLLLITPEPATAAPSPAGAAAAPPAAPPPLASPEARP
jgi:spore germination protein GerM